jgi:LacI family xylobiose transport system transcriptional regulator
MALDTLDEALDSRESRATLARVAEEASVSMSTVSKVLNGRNGVSNSTRARVEQLLHTHGYNRRGATQSAPLIELVFADFGDAWSVEVIAGVERVTRENGLSLVLTTSGDFHSPGPEWIEGVIQRRPYGVVLVFSGLTTEHKKRLRIRNIPFVIVDPAGDPTPDVSSIGSANWSGGVTATRHLIDLGHRDIAMITGPDEMMSSRARTSGYRSALEAAGIPIKPEYIKTGAFHRDNGVELGGQLLDLPNRPTAIFAGNDAQAMGVYEAARARGLAIPEDLSVVGYDDVEFVKWMGPGLTTINQPIEEMAEQATRLVLRMHDTGSTQATRVDLATNLVVRNSTRALS